MSAHCHFSIVLQIPIDMHKLYSYSINNSQSKCNNFLGILWNFMAEHHIFLDKTSVRRYTIKAVYRGSTAKQVLKFGLTQWESTNRVRLGTKQH